MSGQNGMRQMEKPPHDGINGFGMACRISMGKQAASRELRAFTRELMESVSDECIRRGAKDIGHIKAHIEGDGLFYFASAVGDCSGITVNGEDGDPVSEISLTLNSVVFGIEKDSVKEATETSLRDTLARFGYRMED